MLIDETVAVAGIECAPYWHWLEVET